MKKNQIIQKPSPNQTQGRGNWVPDLIVCHITEGNFPGSVNWVTNPASQVSYHFMVSQSGEVFQCVDIKDTAWANGTDNGGGNRDNRHSPLDAVRNRRANANLYTISIGHEGRYSYTRGALMPKQLEASSVLIAHIQAEVKRIWGTDIPAARENIVGHNSIVPIWRPNCPGNKFPYDEIVNNLRVLDDYSGYFRLGHVPDGWAAESWLWAVKTLKMDGTRPQDNITRQEVMTLLHRLTGKLKEEGAG